MFLNVKLGNGQDKKIIWGFILWIYIFKYNCIMALYASTHVYLYYIHITYFYIKYSANTSVHSQTVLKRFIS